MLKAFVKSLDQVAEKFRELYTAVDGGFVPKIEKSDGYELANTENLLGALSKERAKAADAETRVKAYGSITPEQAQQAVTSVAEYAKEGGDKTKRAVDAATQEMGRAWTAEKSALTAKNERLTKKLHENMIVRVIQDVLKDEEVDGNPHLLLPVLTGQMRIREEGENFIAEVIGPDGVARVGGFGKDGSVPMTPKQLAMEYKANPHYADAFKGSGSSGGGADGGSKKQTTAGGADLSKMSPIEKIRYARENGLVQTTRTTSGKPPVKQTAKA